MDASCDWIDGPWLTAVYWSWSNVGVAVFGRTTGGCTDEDLEKIVREQQKHRGDFPGPLPVLIR